MTTEIARLRDEIVWMRERAERAEASLALAEQQVTFERKLADAASNSVDQLTQRLALAEQALADAGLREDQLWRVIEAARWWYRNFSDADAWRATGTALDHLGEDVAHLRGRAALAEQALVDAGLREARLRAVVDAARGYHAAYWSDEQVIENEARAELGAALTRLDETTLTSSGSPR